MQYFDIFPTPIYVSIEEDFRSELLPIAIDYLSRYGSPYLGQAGYISTYGNQSAAEEQHNDLRLINFNKFLKQTALKYFSDHMVDASHWKFTPYYLWNKITKTGAHPTHSHPGSILSGCFYLQIPKQASPIIFNDPRSYQHHVQYPTVFGDTSQKYKLLPEYVLNPTEGMILMWPSWLQHEVPNSVIESERIVVAFNLQPY